VDALTHALTWIACLALALVVNRYVQRWLARDDDETEPQDDVTRTADGAPVVPSTVTDRPWLRPIWSRRGPRVS
jgi:hypothetical protein